MCRLRTGAPVPITLVPSISGSLPARAHASRARSGQGGSLSQPFISLRCCDSLRPMVLGIQNRTENWKTARCLWPFFVDRAVCMARRLGEPRATPTAEVNLELYWKSVRDWCAGRNKPPCEEQLVESCRKLFPDLRQQIEQYGHFRRLREGNYEISSKDHRPRLLTNLINTEIDIVLESPRRLYIGEAKYKSGFHADGKLVLVHQLVRQYVTAKVLVDVLGCDKEIVPFVVVEATGRGPGPTSDAWGPGRRPHQVRFLVEQGWMSTENCLTWDALAAMASERPDAGGEK